jgi:acetylornithine deacetylase/succinyl-diaminopimelate desuccinylase-like protein
MIKRLLLVLLALFILLATVIAVNTLRKGARHFIPIADHVYRFSPIRARPEELDRFHGTNERISVSNLVEMVNFYHRLLENLNQPAP